MAKYHPGVDLLTEYVAGNLPLAQSACVAAHMNYCESCQRTVGQLQEVGSSLFDRLDPEPVGESVLDSVLARLDEVPPLSYSKPVETEAGRTPAILQRLMAGDFTELAWKKITEALRISYLKTGDPNYEFALYHIKAGGKIPEHDHRGSEMTLVLQGGFSDANGSYHEGDFIYRAADDTHAPTALQSEDCICLAATDAPLRFKGLVPRIAQPFLGI